MHSILAAKILASLLAPTHHVSSVDVGLLVVVRFDAPNIMLAACLQRLHQLSHLQSEEEWVHVCESPSRMLCVEIYLGFELHARGLGPA